MAHELPLPPPPRPPLRVTRLLGGLVLMEVAIFFFVPKLNLVELPGFTIQAKPEDLLWLLMVPLLLMQRPRLNNRAALAFGLMLAYLAVSALWYPSNVVMVARLIFYAFPLMFMVVPTARQMRHLATMARAFLYLMAVAACLQVIGPFPYFHTGELLIGPVDRASGIYGNGVEFALMALITFWLLHFLGRSSPGPWLAGMAITLFSGTRLATVALLLSGIVFIRHWPWHRMLGLGALVAGIAAIAVPLASSSSSSDESRLSEVDPVSVVTAVGELLSAVQPSGVDTSDTEGYCFEFDNSLADDQSLAMRLSKLLFVVENVVLGSNKLGFGLGRCIGDAGDNLYVRVLSDGGLPYLALLLAFWAALASLRMTNRTALADWRAFLVTLFTVSFFYDTLYFSRVAPFIFIIVSVINARSGGDLLLRHRGPRRSLRLLPRTARTAS
jgi:hypothetical protein